MPTVSDSLSSRQIAVVLGMCVTVTGFCPFTLSAQGADTARAVPSIQEILHPFGDAGNLATFTGLAVRKDEKNFVLQLQDNRVLRLRIKPDTKAYRGRIEVELDSLTAGDTVQAEAVSAGNGYLDVIAIRFVRAGTLAEKAAVERSPEWVRANALKAPQLDSLADDRRLSAVVRELPPPDPNIPRLRRGVPARRPTPAEVEPATPTRDQAVNKTSEQTLIRALRDRATEFLKALPNFIVDEEIEGFVSSTRPTRWVSNGATSAEVRSENGQEVYRNVQIDGNTKSDFLKSEDLSDFFHDIGKAYSSGEFSNAVPCLLSPRTNAQFNFFKSDRLDGKDVSVYNFSVDRDSGCFGIQAGSQVVYPAARGSFWVQRDSADIMRMDTEFTDIPAAFPTDRAERQIEYDRVKVAGSEYLLAVRAYWYGCIRSTYQCWMNRMSFHDYREFKANSSIRFGEIQ